MITRSILIALDMLRLHKLRAFLTMFGVIIGVMSVTIIVMLSQGFKTYLSKEFAKIGSDTIYLFFDGSSLRKGEVAGNIKSLELADIDYVTERCPKIDIACGYREGGRQSVFYGEKETKNVSIRAIDHRFLQLNRIELLKGRTINGADQDERRSVAMISKDAAKELFGAQDPIGKVVKIQGLTLEIIGETDPQEMMGERQTKALMVPLTTANSKWIGGDQIDLIVMRAKPGIKIDDAMQEVWEAMMVRSGNKPIYRLESSENILKVFTGVVGAAGTVLAGIAALSLLVGGIGIMNIMLVSVTERTKEIGLRKAIGAKRTSILVQFLVEAGVISLVGGLIGMGIAYSLGSIVTFLTAAREWPSKGGLATPFPLPAALAASAFSAMIGMLFGFYPAASAAKLDPIVALRRE